MQLRIGAATVAALALLALVPASPALAIGNVLDVQQGRPDLDARTGSVTPTAAQQQIVSSLGANATWNSFGTPQSLIKYGGYLATGLSTDPVAAAKAFISSNQGLFRLSDQGVSNLELLNDSPMVGSDGHAVIFRQTFGSLPATQDGLITVGVVDGKVAYVSSSSAGDGNTPAAATISAAQAWVLAAQDVGRNVSLVNVLWSKFDNSTGWTGLKAAGLAGLQRSRLTALPTYTQGVRPAYEVLYIDNSGPSPAAYKEYVDAQSGAVLIRQNAVQSLSDASRTTAAPSTVRTVQATTACDPTNTTCTFAGTLSVGATVECAAPEGPFTAPVGTKSIDVEAGEDVSANDIVLSLYYGTPPPTNTTAVGTSDVLFSPEAIHYEPTGGVPAGLYYVQVCPFSHALADYTAPYTYHGVIAMNTATGTQTATTPKWKAFLANPNLDYSATDTRQVACWLDSLSNLTATDSDCQLAVANIASRGPWDFNFQAHQPTSTTGGNNAFTAEAWVDAYDGGQLVGSFGPGAPGQQPHHADRNYSDPWANVWHDGSATAAGGCNPGNLTPGGNDILATVTNLFTGHNRMHDFSYFLGFTETNFNAQLDNFGNTAPGPYPNGREDDPEEGNVQAGAVDGGAQSNYTGRDNANQLTLNDGVPPITNQYLFQPIPGSFYAPCVDGDMDTSVFAHEYTHLISNRMVAGPDSGLSGYQAGSMGESWSDLDAMEYQFEFGYSTGTSPYVIGAYATGNPTVGIRDYAIDQNPLNYSDLGFDTPGPEVHADGEIWNGTNYSIRQTLIDKYNPTYPVTDAARQLACAQGKYGADACPGNRRWIQIVYDAWLLMPSTVSMLDARDTYLAADQMRSGGANQTQLWHAFAARGMGSGASSNTNGDDQAVPSFESPLESNATVTFNPVAADSGNTAVANANIYIGRYEDRAVPIADTDATTSRGNSAKFVPGTYDFVVQAPGYGLTRFTQTFTAGQTATVSFPLQKNWASTTNGATASGDGTNLTGLIDDTENSNWQYAGPDGNGASDAQNKQVTVHLGGASAHAISSVRVSAILVPGQARFTALRQFAVYACNAAVTGQCSTGADFGSSPVYTSPADAFPGGRPRPLAPNLIIRSFAIPTTTATDLRFVVLNNQCTGGPYPDGLDNDPTQTTGTGCVTGSARGNTVEAAEFEAFSTAAPPSADMSVVKTGPATGHVGQPITYIITATNNGPATANGVIVTDTLPKNTGFGSATSTQGSCAPRPHSQIVDCNVGTMVSGATVTVTLVVKPTQKGAYPDTATISATSPSDPNPTNNTSSVTTNVTP